MTTRNTRQVHREWARRIHLHTEGSVETVAQADALATPSGLRARPGLGQVTLDWEPVAGACGYLVLRAAGEGAPYEALGHGGSDVLPVAAPPYADSQVEPGETYWYKVAAVRNLETTPGPPSPAVKASARVGSGSALKVGVDASRVVGELSRVWHMVGSERLSQLLLSSESCGGVDIARDFKAALVQARSELGVETVRAHAIFHDDLRVFSIDGARARFDFGRIDQVFDMLLEIGLRPVVELSFMPADLASDREATVFTYRAIVSPPKDWNLWAELNGRLAAHLVERYGIEEVSRWAFEVWNEPNLRVFWTGTQSEYFRLYEMAALAIKGVDRRLVVGGPGTAAGGWVESFVAHTQARGLPVDFVSTHTYGNVPLDLSPVLERHGLQDVKLWWTEWGVGSTHFGDVHDSAYGAPFVLRGLKQAQGRVDALAYWVVSDHFEELGRPPRLFHNGFGLLSIGNLRKPRYWALLLAEQMGAQLLHVTVEGDGAGSLVDVWAARGPGGTVDLLVWNAPPSTVYFRGRRLLDRTISVEVTGLPRRQHKVSLARVDEEHSNLARLAEGVEWPSEEQWAALRRADVLYEEDLGETVPEDGVARLGLGLAMPGVVRLRLQPC